MHVNRDMSDRDFSRVKTGRSSTGFTLTELLVSLSIVAILLSLTLSGVQRVRETMRRTDCTNRLRQLALGVQLVHGSHRAIPANGGPNATSVLLDKEGNEVRPYTYEISSNRLYYWGVANPTLAPRDQTGSWLYSLLPYVEQAGPFQALDYATEIALFRCPSRGRGLPDTTRDDENAKYLSAGLVFSKTDYAGNLFLMPNLPEYETFATNTDGMAHTILVGEKAHDRIAHRASSWFWDEPPWLGGSKGTARAGIKIIPDGHGIEFRENWGSAHPAGAVFAFADGSVKLLGAAIDTETLLAALVPNDSKVSGDRE